ncbi:MAG: tripartite tricarboxylate transporter substrate binding protein [Burkholderiales bacterium]|nr:tripartite tricarboxylate transporter substrate binding protein [Burkholderiales bacterium]ODU62042.1 MAG: hypothetical protein ABT05_08215 [Lautropia sp. SCN 66-9]
MTKHPVPSLVRRTLLGASAVLGLAASLGVSAQSAAYPDRQVRLVLGFPPGGSTDIVARIVADQWRKELKSPIVVENRAGANATIGTHFVAQAAPDGYTLTLAGLSPLVMAPLLTTTPYDPRKSFDGISSVAFTPEVLAINPKLSATSIKELVELSKRRPVTISSSGNGGLPHLTIEQLKLKTGGNFLHVPYKGASPAVTDTMAGHVDAVVMDLPAVLQSIRNGTLKGIATFHTERSSSLPDVATSVEQGYAELQAVNWHGIFAPAGTEAAKLDVLYRTLNAALNSAETREKLLDAGFFPFTQPSRPEFARYLDSEIKRWESVIKASNIKIQ